MTTRITTIAEKSEIEQGAHVYRQRFGYLDAVRLAEMILSKSVGRDILEANAEGLCNKLADMCGLMPIISPLSVICLCSAWAESHQMQGEYGKWDAWVDHVLTDRFLSTPSLKPLVQSLCHGFEHLPCDLRTCLLYCSLYPHDYLIERDRLIRKWIAEGFVSQEEVAQAYFDELISRNMLLPVLDTMFIVHPMLLALLVCKAKEDNFVACRRFNSPSGSSRARQKTRRLSLYCMDCNPDENEYHHTRSLAVLGSHPVMNCSPYQPQPDGLSLHEFKNLRVLEMRDIKGLGNSHLVDICGLLRLRYVCLNGCRQITVLPREIGRLQNLETLDVRSTGINKLPKEIGKLKHLETLNISCTKVTELPTEIGKLQNLSTLDIGATDIRELPKEIWKLQHLVTLNISCTMVREVPKEIGELQHLRTLCLCATEVRELPMEIGNLQHLRTLNISRTMVTDLGKEIVKLHNLEALDISHTMITELPKEIWKLQNLRTLCICDTEVTELPKEIGNLQHLRTLDMRMTKVRELFCRGVVNSLLSAVVYGDDDGIDFVHQGLMKLTVGVVMSSSGGDEVLSTFGTKCNREDVSILVLFNHFGKRCEVVPVPMHRVAGRHVRVPLWVKQDLGNVCSLDIRLCKLWWDELEFLKQMPNLQALALRLEVLPREPVSITGGGFTKLETFYVDCRLPRAITFWYGAMPILRHLEFKFYTGTRSHDYNYMGIKNLPSLENVVFRCSEYYKSDRPGIRAAIEVVKEEAAEHHNLINLYVNDTGPIPLPKMRLDDKDITDKRQRLLGAAVKRGAAREARFRTSDKPQRN